MQIHAAMFMTAILMATACRSSADTTPVSEPPATPPPPSSPTAAPPPEVEIPADSGDYKSALTDATLYKRGDIDFAELQKRVLARNLPPHPLGDAYLMSPVPMPPPGISFDAKRMPKDWEHTWGEIAMTVFAAQITEAEYDRLHAAAHPSCPPR